MQCDMCGSESILFKVNVEGTELKVCKNCSKYGAKVKENRFINRKIRHKQVNSKPEILDMIVPEFPTIIRQARERLNIKQEDAAKKLNEKESLYQKVESGKIRPTLKLAKKLEKFFNIKLIDIFEKQDIQQNKNKQGPMTIGDMLKHK